MNTATLSRDCGHRHAGMPKRWNSSWRKSCIDSKMNAGWTQDERRMNALKGPALTKRCCPLALFTLQKLPHVQQKKVDKGCFGKGHCLSEWSPPTDTPCDTHSHTDTFSVILPGSLSDILCGILVGIPSDIYFDIQIPSDILPGILSGIYSGVLSDILSNILCDMLR